MFIALLVLMILSKFNVSICFLVRKNPLLSRTTRQLSTFQDKFTLYKDSFPLVTPQQWDKLSQFSECITDWNQKVNLVSRKDIDELIPNHIVPALSISLVKSFSVNESVIDIGTGGGLPGVPLAIIHDSVEFTLLDSNNKKMTILKDIVNTLGLKNVNIVTSRSEDYEGRFDVLVGRGVSNISKFLELSAHLLRSDAKPENGLFYIKGGDFICELTEAQIEQYKLTPVNSLVKSLDSDKFILHIPTKQFSVIKQKWWSNFLNRR